MTDAETQNVDRATRRPFISNIQNLYFKISENFEIILEVANVEYYKPCKALILNILYSRLHKNDKI
jgi:hypothetical protein